MARPRNKAKPMGRLQRIVAREADEANARPVVNAFAMQHGEYETGERRTIVNRGGTPVARWISAGKLSDSQQAAINHCWNLWAAIERTGSLVMDFDRVAGHGNGDGWADQIARDDLQRIKGYVPLKYWSVFECVCRFDEPAGVAGSRLSRVPDEQVTTARVIVQFVADIISQHERLSY